jgi:MscS family membrane protein
MIQKTHIYLLFLLFAFLNPSFAICQELESQNITPTDTVPSISPTPIVIQAISPELQMKREIPPELRVELYGLEKWQWLSLLVIFILLFVVRGILARLTLWLAKFKFVNQSKEQLNQQVAPVVRALSWSVSAFAAQISIRFLSLPDQFQAPINTLLAILEALSLLIASYHGIDLFVSEVILKHNNSSRKVKNVLAPLLSRVGKIIVLICGLSIVAGYFNLNITGLAAGLGLGGIAVALAAKDTLENFFGSFTVYLDQPFVVGDFIKTTDVEGTVEHIGMRSTAIRTVSGSLVRVPNSRLVAGAIDNLGSRMFWRYRARLPLSYDTSAADIERFIEKIRQYLELHPRVRQDLTRVNFFDYNPNSLEVLVDVSFQSEGYADDLMQRESLLLEIKKFSEELNLNFSPVSRK